MWSTRRTLVNLYLSIPFQHRFRYLGRWSEYQIPSWIFFYLLQLLFSLGFLLNKRHKSFQLSCKYEKGSFTLFLTNNLVFNGSTKFSRTVNPACSRFISFSRTTRLLPWWTKATLHPLKSPSHISQTQEKIESVETQISTQCSSDIKHLQSWESDVHRAFVALSQQSVRKWCDSTHPGHIGFQNTVVFRSSWSTHHQLLPEHVLPLDSTRQVDGYAVIKFSVSPTRYFQHAMISLHYSLLSQHVLYILHGLLPLFHHLWGPQNLWAPIAGHQSNSMIPDVFWVPYLAHLPLCSAALSITSPRSSPRCHELATAGFLKRKLILNAYQQHLAKFCCPLVLLVLLVEMVKIEQALVV